MIFHDRKDAGKRLVTRLTAYKNDQNVVVLGLPRGGVVTAYEIARDLKLPLDIVVPRKIGAPQNSEFAIGAITDDGTGIFHHEIIEMYGISPKYIATEVEKEKKESERRLRLYRNGLAPLNLMNKTVLLVDDGIATAATMRAAIASVRAKNPLKIIVAAPVAAPNSLEKIREKADETVVLSAPGLFKAVGQFYEHFQQTTDGEVIELIRKAHANSKKHQKEI